MKILLGMSGGLDSSYAILKLRRMGYDVEGAIVNMHRYTELGDARRVADELGVVLHEVDATANFERYVVSDFISEYTKGRTPNPCIICNSDVKFKALAMLADRLGIEKIATGHYADVVKKVDDYGTRYAIKRSVDPKKDQSYMLWRIPQSILSRVVFPLADETKSGIREKSASELRSVAERPESQEICFIPDNDYPSFIESRIGASAPGDFISCNGKVLGRHKGIIHYTVGQRKGLGISLGERAFITEINADKNTITLDTNDRSSDEFTVTDIVFSGVKEPEIGAVLSLFVKLRYLAPPIEANLYYLGSHRARVKLSVPVRAITPGQSAVFYDSDILALGGFINLI